MKKTKEDLHISPLADASCQGAQFSSAFGNRNDPITNEIWFHEDVDIAKPEGCVIVAAYKGESEAPWWAEIP